MNPRVLQNKSAGHAVDIVMVLQCSSDVTLYITENTNNFAMQAHFNEEGGGFFVFRKQ